MDKALWFISKHKTLLLLIFLALLLRFPWLYTTIEIDEGQFGYTAWRWLSGESLYINLKDNKPPLLYMIYAIPISIFGNSIIPVRLLNNLLFIVSIIFFFNLTKNLRSKKTALFSTLFYVVFMNIPVFEGYLAMSESLLTPFFIMSVYFFERYASAKKTYLLFTSSIFASISLLIKQQVIFVFFILISGLFIYKEKNKLKHAIFIVTVPVVIILITSFLDKQLFLSLLQKTWGEITLSPMGFATGYMPYEYNLFIIVEGSILLLFSIVGLVKTLRSKKIEKNKLLISWLVFAALFALIPPAYGHYYIFLIPPLAIFAGIGTAYAVSTRQSKKAFILSSALLLLVTILLVINHFPDSTLNLGFMKLHWGWSDFKSYDQQVGLASFIKNTTRPEDNILVMGWEPVIYWLSERSPPHDFLAYSSPDSLNLSSLERIMKKEKLAMVLFLDESEGLDKQFEFLSNKKTVQDTTIYEITLNEDYCYLYILRKREDKKVCNLISTPFVKQTCLAITGEDFHECYNITNTFFKNKCLMLASFGRRNLNHCYMVEDENLFKFCMSSLNGEFDYVACANFFKLEESEKRADYKCRTYYAIFMNDASQCEYIEDNDANLFCKESVTSDVSYCKNITSRLTYSKCMVDATSNSDYCRYELYNKGNLHV